MTKRDKPAMSEEEFEKAIKELAQKEFATGKRDDAAGKPGFLHGLLHTNGHDRIPECDDQTKFFF